ncbi:uncharacterized protein N7518_004952 [Penicillium psychrosexuale]|uniref:uncharacterized protein n=1 Tax=Penicillium psychrosexuale TaxID=1002107 RepID=UPI002545A015|nr:uncharacterized protein N7518_004952 [Penicillium psychrosexuale]KAJ5796412.1 hypothetical protein N7518_004952 [Penicillium psychrosexuale]
MPQSKWEIKLRRMSPEEYGKDETTAKKRLVDVVRPVVEIPPASELMPSADLGQDAMVSLQSGSSGLVLINLTQVEIYKALM